MARLKMLLLILIFTITLAFSDCSSCYSACTSAGGSASMCLQTCCGSQQTPDIGAIVDALTALCSTIKNILGIGMMLMVVSAAVVYSVGQVMGAETRARAAVWATSMFNGAIIAALIYLLVPFVLDKMLTGTGVTIPQCFVFF